MQIPAELNPGDTIGIVAPSRAINLDSLKYTIDIIKSKGYNVIIGKSIGRQDNQFAGSDQERANDINDMFANKSVKAIWCARGGYGSVRTLQYVDLELVKQNPKWFIGYSDITVFHSVFHKLDLETLHATMPINIDELSYSDNYNTVFKVLTNAKLSYSMLPTVFNIEGETEGQLVGGNLSVLYSLRATPADIDTSEKILFLEDLDEYLYHVDRMMMNLKYGGYLRNIKGLIVGGMTDMKDNTVPFGKNAEQIIFEHIKDLNIPACFSFDAGHNPKNLALPMGRKAKLSVGVNGCSLSF